jgi:hypothetical protein
MANAKRKTETRNLKKLYRYETKYDAVGPTSEPMQSEASHDSFD